MSQRILVWDVPTRVFHWLLVLSFTGAYLTAESEMDRDIHVVLGYTLLGLLVFRLLWGFFGTRYAQFRSFLFKPGEIIAYSLSMLKGKPAHYIGHNPLGSVSVWMLLGLGILSGVSGVLTYQDIGGDVLEELHEIVSNTMLAVVLIHIAGVVVSSVLHRENLVRAMVTGFKSAEPDQGIQRSYLWLGIIMLVAVVAFWVVYPSIAFATPSAETAHAGHHDDD
ncbi:cytochrome b/b6 domain-containing protein [Candidatus Ferrigenium straubiae]|jgi:cytochrome b|uniref:cytochrome b/b6 domain-containing protein n=1 Tax=Candidatus Ferrigenium straubiae TaxID=2919506 RepID=UPI003F4AB57C